jgi:hypothetical protein
LGAAPGDGAAPSVSYLDADVAGAGGARVAPRAEAVDRSHPGHGQRLNASILVQSLLVTPSFTSACVVRASSLVRPTMSR